MQVTPSFYVHQGTELTEQIFATDLDWTLIRPIRSKFMKDEFDYAFLPNRIEVLQAYIRENYSIVIFTNQAYKGKAKITALKRIDNIIKELNSLNIYPWVLISTEHDQYRKPNIGMWQYLNTDAEAFYVGDAAGRPTDHSDSDRLFAENIGLEFLTPEEIFPNNKVEISDTQAMFIFVGMPGSKKSTFYHDNLSTWAHAEQDTLKTQAKMIKFIKEALNRGESVAVDATNPNIAKRKEYIDLAKDIPVLIIYFVANGQDFNKLRANPVPSIAYNKYYSALEEPSFETDGVPVVELF